jgi:hypothetical protein
MSAASPADPTPPRLNKQGAAAVIDITKRRQARRAAKERDNMRGTDNPPVPEVTPPDPLRMLAEDYEKTFNEYGLTLTDEETASAYQVTLRLVSKILEGARVQGLVDEEQLRKLVELLTFAEDLPRLLA